MLAPCWSLVWALFSFQSKCSSCRNFIPNRFINLLNDSCVLSLAQNFLEISFINLLVKSLFPRGCPSDFWNTVCTNGNPQLLSKVCSCAVFSILKTGHPTSVTAQARSQKMCLTSLRLSPLLSVPSLPSPLFLHFPLNYWTLWCHLSFWMPSIHPS